MLAVLQVDDADDAASAHERDGEKGFVAVFWQLVEELESRVLRGFFGDGDGFAMFGNPSRDSLPNAQLQAVNDFRVRVLGGPQGKFVAFENVHEAGVALHQRGGKFNDARKNFMKSVGCSQPSADFMKHVNM
jgi:hypothetical protein